MTLATPDAENHSCHGLLVHRRMWNALQVTALVTSLGLSAYFMGVARGSPDYWWFGWVVLLPLFVSIRVLPPVKAMLAGAFWGLCLCIVFSVIHSTDNAAAPSVESLILLTAIPGLYCYLWARLTRQIGFSPCLLAVGWMGVELALSPLGLRSGLLAGTQGRGLVLHWIGNFAGCALIAFLVAYICASVFEAITRVSVGAGVRRFVFGSHDGPGRLFPQGSLSVLFDLIRPAQPRARPMALSAQLVRTGESPRLSRRACSARRNACCVR